jgi:hypothetical protein
MAPSHKVGPSPNLLPQAVRCKSPLDCLPIALEGAKMPFPFISLSPVIIGIYAIEIIDK